MAAGTVISGGFPGRVAQEVQPNPKCSGCLHYDGQGGRVGICSIGDKPWNCGDGDHADTGYAPIARGAGKYLPDMSNHGAHAPEVGDQEVGGLYGAGSTRPVTFQQVSLGEEHVHFAKSIIAQHTAMEKSQCRLCKSQGTIGIAPANVGPQVCTCAPIEARTVAKSLAEQLSNLQGSVIDLDDLTDFVYACAKGNFDPSIAKGTFFHAHGKYEVSPAGGGKHHVDFHPKGGGETTRVGTADSHRDARHMTTVHAKRFASGTGAPAGGAPMPKTTRTPAGLPSMKDAVSVSKKALDDEKSELSLAAVEKSDRLQPHTAHFKSPHGKYKVESNHASGEHAVHYTPTNHEHAPAQSVRMKSHEHAVKMAKVHAFVNDHSGEHTHATLHEDHVAIHEPHGGEGGGAAVHKVRSMSQAREHLGY